MSFESFAQTPEPPYFAVIFSTQRREADEGYTEASERMMALARQQPGYLGVETVRGADGFGITVSYWEDEESIKAWKHHAEHAEVRKRGRLEWYEHFELRVARVERAFAGPRGDR